MGLTPGTRVGPYEVVSTLGAGGMGEVFLARDTQLQRDVALKILPEPFATDPERLARFEREAQVLASLNCQNIAAIYGVEESTSGKALVLELVNGPTLADRIAAGPMPLDEAVPVARQIVDALDAAHGQGIIHRDLKPTNIKVRADGTVKVLDFGLAKAVDATASAGGDPLNSPTLTARTQTGVILGTAAYMPPEQARGKPVDKRADIWAFGCVLYEMLTGRRAFAGDDVSDTIASVILKEPDWSALPTAVPAPLRRLLRRTLVKDPRRRLADIADARLELDEGLSNEPQFTVPVTPRWRRALPWAVAGALGLGLLALLVLGERGRAAPPRTPVRLSTHLGADASLVVVSGPGAGGPAIALSPKGDVLVFSARSGSAGAVSLWLRRLDQLTASPIAGTENGAAPVCSPDGQSVAFFADGKLKKVALAGGVVSTLANAPAPRGAYWADDNTILFAPDRVAAPIFRVSALGGRVEPVTSLRPEEATHRFPEVLPGGKALLYTAHTSTSGFDTANIMAKPLPDGSPRVVVDGGYHGRYVASGHLLFVRNGALLAVAFDPATLQTMGPPVTVLESVTSSTRSGVSQVAVANDGTLIYLTGRQADVEGPLLWMHRNGTTSTLRALPAINLNVRFSPDGRRLALDSYDGQQWDIWIYDSDRDRLSRLTDDPTLEQRPVWSVDGTRIVYASIGGDASNQIYSLYWQRADRSGGAQRLTQSANLQRPASWHPSGRFLAFTELNQQTSWDVMMLPLEGDEATGWKPGTPTAFLTHRSAETEPMFSPDGHYVAYQSDESGQDEIYVSPFPGPGGRELVSTGGGTHPQWAPNERELLYVSNGRIMAAPYSVTAGVFRAEKPRLWTNASFTPRTGPASRSFDLHPDGKRFAFAATTDEETAARLDHVVLVINFFDELRRLAPPRR